MKKENKLQIHSIDQIFKNLPKVEFSEILKVKKPIIFDTNFLFVTFEFKIDIIYELERIIGKSYNLYIYKGTIDELKNIESKKDKNKRFIPLILKMLQIYNFKIINSKIKYIDEQILSNLNKNVLIATNDKKLRQLIKKGNCKYILMRQKNHLEIM